MINNMYNQIRELELLLLDPSLRKSKQKLNELIDDEFIEIGVSGKIYNKQDILDSLPYENANKFKAYNFKFTEISNKVILIIYETEKSSFKALRSSIWRKSDDNWKLIFHQGTEKHEF